MKLTIKTTLAIVFRLCAVVCALAIPLTAQPPSFSPRYCATSGAVVLAGAGTTFTVQQPATSVKTIVLDSALVYTSVASSFTQSVNGTAASATAGTVAQIPGNTPTITATATAWTASNVGAGTSIAGTFYTYAGGPGVSLDLTNGGYNLTLKPTGTASNYSITIASMTGTAQITMCWREQ